MTHPAADSRYVTLDAPEADAIARAASIAGTRAVCSRAGVRTLETYYRAVGRGQVLAAVARSLIATAEQILANATEGRTAA